MLVSGWVLSALEIGMREVCWALLSGSGPGVRGSEGNKTGKRAKLNNERPPSVSPTGCFAVGMVFQSCPGLGQVE